MSDIDSRKQTMRQALMAKRKALSTQQKRAASDAIVRHVQHMLDAEGTPTQLLVYKSLPDEVNTDALLRQDKAMVFVPRMLEQVRMEWVRVQSDTVWQHQAFGVQAPVAGELWQASPDMRKILLCPLLGFDRQGNRLGMGKGYFDRWLDKHGHMLDAVVGLAFACQEVPQVPMEAHDVPLQTIITEHGVLSCPAT